MPGARRNRGRDRLKEVDITTAGGKVSAEGPKTMGKTYYSVSYEVFVPSKIDLDLHSVNGGVTVRGVTGTITAGTTNGGLNLTDLAGKVTARTTNGGVRVQLAGSSWQGEGFDVSTVNGGVTIQVPTEYSAQLEVKTVNGGLHSDIPVTVQGQYSGKRVSATLGKGGSPVKVSTTNGGVRLNRAGV